MALLFGKPTEYAIRALIFLAARQDRRPVSVQEIAHAEQLSSHHLSKVMKSLTRYKLVQPVRGPGGGYIIIHDPSAITLWEVMAIMGALGGLEECAIGWAECRDDNPCPLHTRWSQVRDRIIQYLQGTTIADLVQIAHQKGEGEGSLHISLPAWVEKRKAV
jgi:Rrf2 family protein